MNLNNGLVSCEEWEVLDGYAIALRLIDTGVGIVTSYGVVYDNSMKLEPLYDGRGRCPPDGVRHGVPPEMALSRAICDGDTDT